jgi:hypothetical protein
MFLRKIWLIAQGDIRCSLKRLAEKERIKKGSSKTSVPKTSEASAKALYVFSSVYDDIDI